MSAQVRSSMDVILPLVETRLALYTGLPAERIIPAIADEIPHLQGDQDLVLRLGGWRSDQPWALGGGRYTLKVVEVLEVEIRTRLALDPTGAAREWLVNATYGALQLRSRVLSALHGFQPEDVAGNVLVAGDILVSSARRPRPEGRSKAANYGSEVIPFDVSYIQELPDPPE